MDILHFIGYWQEYWTFSSKYTIKGKVATPSYHQRVCISSWRILSRNVSPDRVAISRDISKYGNNVDFSFKRQLVDAGPPEPKINVLSRSKG